MSYQTIDRRSVVEAAEDYVSTSAKEDPEGAAAFIDACIDMYAVDQRTRVTTVHFDCVDHPFEAFGLPQGCSLSIALQAITIAWALQRAGGIRGMAAHDDLWLIDDDTGLPDLGIGGQYNQKKCGRTGLRGEPISAWGRPIEATAVWVEKVWLRRWSDRCARLRSIGDTRKDAAIAAMALLRGPGACAAHWIRGLSPLDCTPRLLTLLKQADDEWLRTVAHLAGSQSPADASRVYGRGSTLGHLSAAAAIRTLPHIGAARSYPVVARIAGRLGVPVNIGQFYGCAGGCYGQTTVDELSNRRDAAIDAAGEPVAPLNLWSRALHPSRELGCTMDIAFPFRSDVPRKHRIVQFALAHALGLSVWPALLGATERDRIGECCSLCAATATRPSPNGTSAQTPTLDKAGRHVSCCKGMWNVLSQAARHNALVRAAAELARRCGFDAAVHDGPIFA
jgi:hypothetical protein